MAGALRPVLADDVDERRWHACSTARLSSESILSLSASARVGLTRRHLSVASLPSPLTFSNATVWPLRDELEPRRVVRAELEHVLAAVVAGALLQVVREHAVDRHDRAFRHVARVDGVVVGLATRRERRARAAHLQRRRSRRACRGRTSSGRPASRRPRRSTSWRSSAAADQSLDRAVVGARLQRLRDLPLRVVLGELQRLAVGRHVDAVDLVALELQRRSCRADRTSTC